MHRKQELTEELSDYCENHNLKPGAVNQYLESCGSTPLGESRRISDLASRPELKLQKLLEFVPRGTNYPKEVVEAVEVEVKYKGYIEREKTIAGKIKRLEELAIPEGFDFEKVPGLTIECRQKLKRYGPRTIAQASRISGVSPADISVLLVYFGR
jgi:tRNA uridine 5-carboxymethylaminomethyl modification enzyme